MGLTWRGDEVRDHVVQASIRAVDSILAECVVEAKQAVPRRTTALQGSIQMRPARQMDATHVSGFWGSFAIHYAIYVEKGTRPHFPPIAAIEQSMRVSPQMAFLIARSISRHGTRPHPYLVPTAERLYPQLAARIRAEMGQ